MEMPTAVECELCIAHTRRCGDRLWIGTVYFAGAEQLTRPAISITDST